MDPSPGPMGGHEVDSPGSCPGPELPTRPTWPGTGCPSHCPWTRLYWELLGRQAPRHKGSQSKRTEPSWWQASILRAKDLLPKGLRHPKTELLFQGAGPE